MFEISALPSINLTLFGNSVYYIKLSDDNLQKIRSQPYLIFKKDYFELKNECNLVGFCHNQAFSDLIGIHTFQIEQEFEGFDFFQRMFSKDWSSFYEKYIKFNLDLTAEPCILNPNELYIINEEGESFNGYFT